MQAPTSIINLNPVDITIIKSSNDSYKFVKPAQPISLKTELTQTGSFNNIPVSHVVYGKPSMIPEKKEGTIYLVSMLVCQWFATNCPERQDILGPSSSKMQYENGRPIGTGGLVRHPNQIKLLDRSKEPLNDWKEVKFVNLTGMPIIIAKGDTSKFNGSFETSPTIELIETIEPDSKKATVKTTEIEQEKINEIPVAAVNYGKIENLPEAQDETEPKTIYIVTQLVAQVAATLYPARKDIVCPDFTPGVGHCFRDKTGKIAGTTGFIRY